ncbi:MAG: hypothetical protein KME43_19255 [Myxacorys chilensis ATA2-1-KO14]|jgi:hypothetical protein|nr:hypothetical protein [Myxacorys chilensis ATA2-1-KO14]
MTTEKQGKDSEPPIQPTLQELHQRIIDQELKWSLECSLRNHIQLVERAIYQTQVDVEQATNAGDFDRAAKLKYGRITGLEQHLESINAELEQLRVGLF